MKLPSLSIPLVLAALALSSLEAQSPTPIVMQAVAPGSLAPKPAPAASPADTTAEMQNMMQLLQAMQKANLDTIQKQQAALETLDALQQAAEEIKIFSKRG
jgi:hypothetical protein